MTGDKLVSIVVSEFIEAFIFLSAILILSSFPDSNIRNSLIPIIIGAWVTFGLLTPFVIFLELEKVFSKGFG